MLLRIAMGLYCLPLLLLVGFVLRDARAQRYSAMAQTAFKAGQYGTAGVSIERALNLTPGNAELWLERAEIERSRWLLWREKESEARMNNSFTRAAALSPLWDKPLDRRSQVEVTLQDYAAALRSIEAAIARAPGSGTYWVVRGQYLELLGDIPQATQAYQKALSLYDSPEATAALERLGGKR